MQSEEQFFLCDEHEEEEDNDDVQIIEQPKPEPQEGMFFLCDEQPKQEEEEDDDDVQIIEVSKESTAEPYPLFNEQYDEDYNEFYFNNDYINNYNFIFNPPNSYDFNEPTIITEIPIEEEDEAEDVQIEEDPTGSQFFIDVSSYLDRMNASQRNENDVETEYETEYETEDNDDDDDEAGYEAGYEEDEEEEAEDNDNDDASQRNEKDYEASKKLYLKRRVIYQKENFHEFLDTIPPDTEFTTAQMIERYNTFFGRTEQNRISPKSFGKLSEVRRSFIKRRARVHGIMAVLYRKKPELA
mgnify:CR=1 FL=1